MDRQRTLPNLSVSNPSRFPFQCLVPMARPYAFQYVFAHWMKIIPAVGAVAFASGIAIWCEGFSLWLVLAMVPALPLGALIGWMTLGPVIHLVCGFLNGAPYRNGDVVYILVRPHRGRVTTIYDVWDTRGSVRVDLGEQARREVKDVFDDLEVCRVKWTPRF
jgi:hypothetical protein